MEIQQLFKEYATDNLTAIPHPSRNSSLSIDDVSSLVDLLICVLNFEIEEPTLKRIKDNFEVDFETIYNLNLKELPSAIEGLAATYESFLKKIAFLKFDDSSLFYGDGQYKALNKCTLFDLIEGKTPVLNLDLPIPSSKNFPSLLVPNSGLAKVILDFMRDQLRNAVHYAKKYTRAQLINYSNIVLGAYLIAIKENIDFLKKKFFREFNYLAAIVNNSEFRNINRNYIDLFGREDEIDFENIAVEQLDGQKLFESISAFNLENEIDEADNDVADEKEAARIDTVLNISKDTRRFIVIGEPGSGKTTSLQKIYYENAYGLLNGSQSSRIPVFIKASAYTNANSFIQLIENEINFLPFNELVLKQNVLVLIDGLNEIEDEYKRLAIRDLEQLMDKYDSVNFIITTRKFGFINHWGLMVYELKSFNESQIKQLIVNIVDETKAEILWKQIQANKSILELASNPLMLMMIIRVSLRNNEIPPNKGMLFKLFNDAILAREQKVYSTDIDTKKDVLSCLAYWMRKNGIFKNIKKVQAKELARLKLEEINSSIDVNKIIHELADNNFFIEKEDNLEFYHETQQEYFVALEVQNQFFRNYRLEFDYSEDKWFEPLVICSDLFTSDEDRIKFFELIYIGEKNNAQKRLDEIDENDINPKFNVACKIAYNLKDIHPRLYSTAERYLNNYLVIWMQRRMSNVIISDFVGIIKAVASLSSEGLFKKFFYNINYLEIWFYNQAYDKGANNEKELQDFDKRYNTYCKSFLDNLSDFVSIYKILNQNQEYLNELLILSKSLHYNLNVFNKYLFENTPINQLIQCFKETKSKSILKQIGRSDLEFFIENYYLLNNPKEDDFYEFIIKYHIRNKRGIDVLMSAINNNSLNTNVRIQILKDVLNRPELNDTVFSALRELFLSQDVLIFFEETKMLLNRFPLSLLKKYELSQLYTYPDVEKEIVNIELFHEEDNHYIFKLDNKNNEASKVSQNIDSLYHNDRQIDFSNYTGDKAALKESKIFVVKGAKDVIVSCFEKYNSGGPFTLHYTEGRFSRTEHFTLINIFKARTQSEILLVEVDEYKFERIRSIFKHNKRLKVLIGQEFLLSFNGLGSHYVSSYLRCRKDDLELKENNTRIEIRKVSMSFDKPFNYHRDIIKSHISFIRHLKSNIDKLEVRNFIKDLGLVYMFTDEVKDLKPGVVVAVNKELHFFAIYKFYDKKFLHGYIIRSNEDDEIDVGAIVNIEWNQTISLISIKELPNELFVESVITNFSESGSEGFINGGGGKDYYFLSAFCDFVPKARMQVRFVPGLNFSKNNQFRPMAYCITRNFNQMKIARVHNVIDLRTSIDVYLIDLNTNEQLFSRVYTTQYIENLDGNILIDQLYSYYVPDRYAILQPNKLQRVSLLSLENDIVQHMSAEAIKT